MFWVFLPIPYLSLSTTNSLFLSSIVLAPSFTLHSLCGLCITCSCTICGFASLKFNNNSVSVMEEQKPQFTILIIPCLWLLWGKNRNLPLLIILSLYLYCVSSLSLVKTSSCINEPCINNSCRCGWTMDKKFMKYIKIPNTYIWFYLSIHLTQLFN